MERIPLKILSCFVLLMMVNASQTFNRTQAQIQEGNQEMSERPSGYLNWKTRTMGGMQFWSDVHFAGGFKIQRNSNTGHHRLISPEKVRLAWGNLAHCRAELNGLIANGKVAANRGKFVIALHGLMRTNLSMEPIASYLNQQGGFTVVNFQYASSRDVVAAHASDLRNLIEGLGDGVTEINFVGYSLGNIVVRHYLHNSRLVGSISTLIWRFRILNLESLPVHKLRKVISIILSCEVRTILPSVSTKRNWPVRTIRLFDHCYIAR
jgi:hypothetical protein